MNMRKITALLILIIGLTGCQDNSKETRIRGEIKGLDNDTLYLYGVDGNYERIDTIIAANGKIDHTLTIDTLGMATLLFDRQTEVSLFLDKKAQIEIQGSTDALEYLTIKGTEANDEFTAFQQSLKGLGKPSDQVLTEKAEEFIRKHHSSLVSIHLLNTYFVQKTSPDFKKIKELIELMTGTLQDNPMIEKIKAYTEQEEKVAVGRTLPFFSLPNAKGEKISRTTEKFKDKYLLIHFWASWDEPSMANHAELLKLDRKYKKSKDFAMLGISLDIDKAAWKEAIKSDTLTWEQVSDFNGLNSEIVSQLAILDLPTNLLVEPNGQIVARDIQGDSLTNKLKEVLKIAEEKRAKEKKTAKTKNR